MLIDQINLNLLRIFECVYRARSMTKAAEELHMTQSGVSQSVKHLEDILQVQLFDRVKQRPIPTHHAHFLYKNCTKNLYDIEKALNQLTGKESELKGEVSIGLPLEFGNNLVIPLLAKIGEERPQISFRIKYGHSSEMNKALLDGNLDFAFCDDYTFGREVHIQVARKETLSLCCCPGYAAKIGTPQHTKAFYEQLDYVDYVEDAPMLKMWFRHHLKNVVPDLRIRASLMDVQGMGKMIAAGLGLGILPLHVVDKLGKQGQELYIFEGSGKPLLNSISLAYVEGRTVGPAVAYVRQTLMDALKI